MEAVPPIPYNKLLSKGIPHTNLKAWKSQECYTDTCKKLEVDVEMIKQCFIWFFCSSVLAGFYHSHVKKNSHEKRRKRTNEEVLFPSVLHMNIQVIAKHLPIRFTPEGSNPSTASCLPLLFNFVLNIEFCHYQSRALQSSHAHAQNSSSPCCCHFID